MSMFVERGRFSQKKWETWLSNAKANPKESEFQWNPVKRAQTFMHLKEKYGITDHQLRKRWSTVARKIGYRPNVRGLSKFAKDYENGTGVFSITYTGGTSQQSPEARKSRSSGAVKGTFSDVKKNFPNLTGPMENPFPSAGSGARKFRRWVNSNKKNKLPLLYADLSDKKLSTRSSNASSIQFKRAWRAFNGEYVRQNPNASTVPSPQQQEQQQVNDKLGLKFHPNWRNAKFTEKVYSSHKKITAMSNVKIAKCKRDNCAVYVSRVKWGKGKGNAWHFAKVAFNNNFQINAYPNALSGELSTIRRFFMKMHKNPTKSVIKQYNKPLVALYDRTVGQTDQSQFSNLKLGQVVGIYHPDSSFHAQAFYESLTGRGSGKGQPAGFGGKGSGSGPTYFFAGKIGTAERSLYVPSLHSGIVKTDHMGYRPIVGNTMKGGFVPTLNTHVGFVGATIKGKPIIFHNIGGQIMATGIDAFISGKTKDKLVWASKSTKHAAAFKAQDAQDVQEELASSGTSDAFDFAAAGETLGPDPGMIAAAEELEGAEDSVVSENYLRQLVQATLKKKY